MPGIILAIYFGQRQRVASIGRHGLHPIALGEMAVEGESIPPEPLPAAESHRREREYILASVTLPDIGRTDSHIATVVQAIHHPSVECVAPLVAVKQRLDTVGIDSGDPLRESAAGEIQPVACGFGGICRHRQR